MHDTFYNSLRVFRYGHYAHFWSGRFISTLASFTLSVTLGWQVYTIARLTRGIEESAFLVGMVGLAQFLPLFALTLITGAAADRYDRRKILLAATLLQLVCATALAVIAFSAQPSLLPIFAVAALFGVARAFIIPADVGVH